MQIIPISNMTEPVSLLEKQNKKTAISIDSYSSYSIPFGFANSLMEANKDLTVKEEENITSYKMLSYEEILRLRNELLDAKKITEEEANALSYLLNLGGEHSLKDIQDTITNGAKGLDGIKADEYVALQQFLFGIGLDAEGVKEFEQNIKKGNTAQALQSIAEHSGNFEALVKNITPILNKIFTGKYGSDAPLEDATKNIGVKEFLAKLEELAGAVQGKPEDDNASIDIIAEVKSLLEARKEKKIMEENSSTFNSAANEVERKRQSATAMHKGLLALETIEKQEAEVLPVIGNSAHNEGNMQREFQERLFGENAIGKHANIQNNSGSSLVFTTKEAKYTQLPTEYKAPVLKAIENGLLEIHKGNGSRLTVELNPRDLGRVELSLQYKDGHLSAILRPDKIEVEKSLKESIHALMKSLDEQGIKIEKITIAESKEQWQQYQGDNSQHHNKQEDSRTAGERFTQEIERSERIRSLLVQAGKEALEQNTGQKTKRLLDRIA